MAYQVSKVVFERLVEKAIAGLPEQFREALEEVPIEIRSRPTPQQLSDAGLEEDELLLGLYVGVPLTERSTGDSGRLPDRIFIFQEDCELVSENEKQLVTEVRTTVFHELGHYFGMSEDALDELGYG